MVIVWIASLLLGWEQLNYVQLLGYIILTIGTFIFNEIFIKKTEIKNQEEE
jgi:DNA-binding transcriptional regulator of glucitol operon